VSPLSVQIMWSGYALSKIEKAGKGRIRKNRYVAGLRPERGGERQN